MLIIVKLIPDRRSSKNCIWGPSHFSQFENHWLHPSVARRALLRQLLVARHIKVVVPGVREDDLASRDLARCLEPENVCHSITTRATLKRQLKETLYTRHRNTAEPMIVGKDKKAILQALHTDAVNKAVKSHERNVVLDGRPPPISNSEKDLTWAPTRAESRKMQASTSVQTAA